MLCYLLFFHYYFLSRYHKIISALNLMVIFFFKRISNYVVFYLFLKFSENFRKCQVIRKEILHYSFLSHHLNPHAQNQNMILEYSRLIFKKFPIHISSMSSLDLFYKRHLFRHQFIFIYLFQFIKIVLFFIRNRLHMIIRSSNHPLWFCLLFWILWTLNKIVSCIISSLVSSFILFFQNSFIRAFICGAFWIYIRSLYWNFVWSWKIII